MVDTSQDRSTSDDVAVPGQDDRATDGPICFVKRDFPEGLGWGDCAPALACPEWCSYHRSDFVPVDR